MGIKVFKPTTPSLRGTRISDFSDINKVKPYKALLAGKKKISCKGSKGRISVRFRGGSHKRRYRKIDFFRKNESILKISSIEYDPNRTARIALVADNKNKKKYILAPFGVSSGSFIDNNSVIGLGSCIELNKIPVGSNIYNIEINPGKGAKMVRSAGVFAKILSSNNELVCVKLPSGEIRNFNKNCKASIGRVSNIDHDLIKIGKAGRSRWKGFRPHNRGVSMNPIDHPHGGGEGKTSGGRHPCTPWGKPTKGYKTRRNKKTDIFIVKRRK